ncbi:sarcosine oxidase subunit gamma [Pseudoruegeria sp. HB172150]|uniref:sarcosine oxidase subunit gamma n=1 Tax=Pseudoruegeria sp. HB172150 TaxID=2721164 RepID=UPI001556443B|nr:hypothetical protein [Pseudoruegeria sp. HB172150]
MAEYTLTPTTPLAGLDLQQGETRLREITDLALLSLAIPQNGEAKAVETLKSAWNLETPNSGRFTQSGIHKLIRIAPDQLLLATPDTAPDAARNLAVTARDALYSTEQTGAWTVMELTGTGSISTLERLCMLDLAEPAMPVGAANRTLISHQGVMLLRLELYTFWLMSASSSAKSLAHSVETAIGSVA